jgi:multiple sugar transport system permease protein
MNAPKTPKSRKKRRNWAPYLLILPSIVYLGLFFAYPMVNGLILSVREPGALLTLRADPQRISLPAGQLPHSAQVSILDRQGNLIPEEELGQANLVTEDWYQIRSQDSAGEAIEGWAPGTRIRVRETNESGAPVSGTIRPRIGSEDPLTAVYAEPNENSEIAGTVEERTPVEILDQVTLEVWFLVAGEINGESVEGWAPSRYLQVFGDGTAGRVSRGDTGQFTTRYFEEMFSDRFFMPALRTTLLLMAIIIPIQFVLAITMALVIQANPRGSGLFLYIFTIGLGVSDLAVGIVWYSIFTQLGYLNSFLQALGLIDSPITYLSATRQYWILIAIILAEVWRATAIVMVIIVAGMQAISREVLEAAEIFGAGFWQRLRYVILPLLRPSIQVALILRTILAFQVFAVVVVLGGGDIVTVLANETYRQYYDLRDVNVAAAYAVFILLLSMATAVFYLRAVRTQEEATG